MADLSKCSVLQRVAACYSVLQDDAGVAVCCSVLQRVRDLYRGRFIDLQHVAACCSMLQHVGMCWSTLQYVAVYCSE